MFGTIGHARLKAGHQDQMRPLLEEWRRTVRPKVPGAFLNLLGHADGRPDEVVFVALAQDRDTYRNMAAMPEQDAWYRRFVEHVDGEVRWEDVEMEILERA